jgi:hypothetical protein
MTLWASKKPFKAFALIYIACTLMVLLTIKSASASEFDVKAFLDKTYISVGAGYKFDELQLNFYRDDGTVTNVNDPLSARIEVGYQYSKNLTFGISHHSQWRTGFPFNSESAEYYKTEFFIDYKFYLGDLF